MARSCPALASTVDPVAEIMRPTPHDPRALESSSFPSSSCLVSRSVTPNPTMTPLRLAPLLAAIFALALPPVAHAETEDAARPAIEFLSPDGQFGFRYNAETETAGQSYDLIRTSSGEALARVLEADLDPSASARFGLKVLWRPDSQAVAATITLMKRGSYVAVYLRDGATFREVKLPELLAEIPEKVMKGKSFPHIVALNSQTAPRWQKDGALVVEIENIQDGAGSTITAHRTVILRLRPPDQAAVTKSTIKFQTEMP